MIDLHMHSKYSDDGELSPNEIIKMCKNAGMKLVSITDHNSVLGVEEAINEGKKEGIEVLSGVELDCCYEGKMFHLLGYGFDHTRKEFLEIEQDIFRQEMNAAEEKISLFRSATGIPINTSDVMDAANGGIVTGELIAEIALEIAPQHEILKPYQPGGEKSDMPNVHLYWDYFSAGKPAYVPINYISLPDAKELNHSASGVSVLAHPWQNLADDYDLLNRILSEGITGIEIFSSYHPAEAKAGLLEIARLNKLLITCGSDFHGKNKPHINIGNHGATINDDEIKTGIHKFVHPRIV